ncbi:molybdopterin-containing oxidoreductase family protein [Dethiosulfatarculus sandiegensis]|uniref:Molybdopterin oxidoreductase n=1 Tax=Dethiosulfatarculus sandiegensis TaxID=1429043 RepID=A0A0D2JZ69_9BACT|nr:molybdopterin-dependent oxidoreductase [Dethiosulfatarculus sandiegensis]KIX14845.1 hypothetical protein X474_06785 [Dethiosulfatarculus sandiegensis]
MEWDRRTFVKFAVGAALGLGASPLAPKLTDDVAIWTQNWSWVPEPADGEVAFANSVNPATGTGVKVRMVANRTKGQRFIRVEGNPDHPLSRGGVTPADATALQLHYSDAYRVRAPQWREPATGAPRRVSWDKALNYVAGELKKLKDQGKEHTVVMLGDDPKTAESELMMRFMASYGSPNLAFTPSAAQTWDLACVLMSGNYDIGFDLEGAEYVVSFGTPLFEGFGAPVATRKALSAWRDNDVKFVQVEPRASVTAGRANTWLACKPGTEGAVALGIASALVKEGAYDKDLASQALGFEDGGDGPGFKALLLNDYTPEKVAAITGVPKDKLLKVAKAFAKAPKALAVCGPDNSGDPGRLYDFMAVLALNMLKGNLGKEGGLLVRQPLPVNPLGEQLKVSAKPRLDGGHEKPLAVTNLAALAEGAVKGDPYKPGAVIIVGSNPLFTGPQANLIREMLDKAPLVVAVTPFMDETAQLADVVLPAKTFLESWGDSGTAYGSPVSAYGIHKPLIAEPGEAKATGDCLLALAKVMGGEVAKALDFDNMEKVLKTKCADMGDFRKLAEKGYWVQEKPLIGKFCFSTSSGRPEFKSSGLEIVLMRMAEKAGNKDFLAGLGIDPKKADLAAMPHYQKPQALAKVDKKYPLLMAGIPSLRTAQASLPASPYMMKVLSDETLAYKNNLVVEINPATAAELGLAEDDGIAIESASGEIKAIVHLFEGAAPGMVFVPMGLGHTAFGEYLKDKGDNFQKAVMVTTDAMSGLPQWGLSPVRVKKAKGAAHV